MEAATGPILPSQGVGILGGAELAVDTTTMLEIRCGKLGLAAAAGGDVNRARLLHDVIATALDLRSNQNGFGASDLRLLLHFIITTLGADVNTPDDIGATPLHVAMRSDYRLLGATIIVPLLLAHGADKAALTPRGHTLFGRGYCGWQDLRDHARAMDLDNHCRRGGEAEQAEACERLDLDMSKMRAVLPDHIAASLTDGLMSPRMYRRLLVQAELLSEHAKETFGHCSPFCDSQSECRSVVKQDLTGFEYIPLEVAGDEVCESFAKGFVQCLTATYEVLASGKLPTSTLVEQELARRTLFDTTHTSCYIDQGVSVAYAIDAVLGHAERACDDGTYEDFHCHWSEEDAPSLAIPELYKNFDIIKGCLIGLSFERGPFLEPPSPIL